MLFNQNMKNTINSIRIHAELIMYGDEFLEISNTDGVVFDWLSLCEGGSIASKGSRSYPNVEFRKIVDCLISACDDFSRQECEEANVGWEIQCTNQEDELVASIDFGYWDKSTIIKIIRGFHDIINDTVPLQSIIDTLEA